MTTHGICIVTEPPANNFADSVHTLPRSLRVCYCGQNNHVCLNCSKSLCSCLIELMFSDRTLSCINCCRWTLNLPCLWLRWASLSYWSINHCWGRGARFMVSLDHITFFMPYTVIHRPKLYREWNGISGIIIFSIYILIALKCELWPLAISDLVFCFRLRSELMLFFYQVLQFDVHAVICCYLIILLYPRGQFIR